MTALRTGLSVQRATTTWSAAADIERDLITKRHWLKRAAGMERVAAVIGILAACDVRTLLVAELTDTARIS
jgi:hypothetical protein